MGDNERRSDASSSRQPPIIPEPSDPMPVARLFVEELYTKPHGVELRYHRGVPYIWNGACWAEVAIDDLRGEAYRYLEHARYVDSKDRVQRWKPARHKVHNLLDALQHVTFVDTALDPPLWIDGDGLDPPPGEIVSMRNGLLHVPSRTLLSHSPRFFAHTVLPFGFVADAPVPRRWLNFLSKLWPDDEDSIMVLQEVMGYLLAGGTNLQKIFLLVGPKRAGKGTIGRVLGGLLGDHNVVSPTLSSLATNFGLSPLIGKPLALVADARLSPRAETHIIVERLLSISGEDSLTVDRKFREPWTGRLSTRFLLMTNELPRLNDASGALPSRFVLLVLTKSFYGEENPQLTSELVAESPSIFNWALEGLERLVARGRFEQPLSSREAMQRLDDLASPIRAFVRDRCIVEASARVGREDLWTEYRSWCDSENRHAGTKSIFGRDLQAAVSSIRRSRPRQGDQRRYEYVGIGIRDSEGYSAYDPGPPGPCTDSGLGGPGSEPLNAQLGDEATTDGRF